MSLFTRRHRIEQLAVLGDVTGLREALVGATRSGAHSDEDLCAAASALVDLGEPGITALVETILSDPGHAHFDRIDIHTFHRASCPRAVELLSEALLRHPDTDVRIAACGVLRRLGTPLADEAFAAAVADPDPHVRLWAALGLASDGDDRGARTLLEWVAHSDDPVPALVGLLRLGDAGLVPVLEQLRDSSRTPSIAGAIDRTIAELQAHPARHLGPNARLERVRDRLRSIELVDRLATPGGQELDRARRQIPLICDQVDSAIAALRTRVVDDGRPVHRTEVGVRLAALAAEASGAEFDRLMAFILEPRGVRAFRAVVAELDVIASDLQERRGVPQGVAE